MYQSTQYEKRCCKSSRTYASTNTKHNLLKLSLLSLMYMHEKVPAQSYLLEGWGYLSLTQAIALVYCLCIRTYRENLSIGSTLQSIFIEHSRQQRGVHPYMHNQECCCSHLSQPLSSRQSDANFASGKYDQRNDGGSALNSSELTEPHQLYPAHA